jgi:hypothetical protein
MIRVAAVSVGRLLDLTARASRPRCGTRSTAGFRPVVDRAFTVRRAADAHRYLETGQQRGPCRAEHGLRRGLDRPAMTAEEMTSMRDARWMLVTYHEDDPGKPHVGIAADGVVYRAPELLAGRSMLEVLADWEPGDVIVTRSPAGVSLPRGEFLAPGDDVVVQVEQVGTLRHRVVDAR